MLRLMLLLVTVLTGSQTLADDLSRIRVQQPFLWECRADDKSPVSYLFGTIHVNDPNITQLHPRAAEAFQASDAVWFEIDFQKDAAAQSAAMALPPGQTLQQLLPPATLQRIDRRLKNLSPLMSRKVLPEIQVVLWPIILASLEAQMRHLGKLPMDMHLQAQARSAGKSTGGLEDPATQLKPLTDLPLKQQIEFLEASLDVMDQDDRQGISQLGNLVSLYAAGKERPLQDYLLRELRRPRVSEEVLDLFVKALLTDRNQRMAEAIHERCQAAPDQTHFFAVGTAHLLGPESVQVALKKHGYRISRVTVD